MIKDLFKHSGIFFSGSIVSKVATTLAWILLAKILVPPEYGIFTLYFMILQLSTFFADFGLNQYYLKKVEGFDKSGLFNKILAVRTHTLAISIVVLSVILFGLKIFTPAVNLIFLISLVPMAYLSILDGYYLEQKMGLRVSLKLGSIGGICIMGFVLFQPYLDLTRVFLLLLFAFSATLIWIAPWRKIKLTSISFSDFLSVIKSSSPYAYLTLTSFFYNRGDAFLVSYFKGDAALGIYGLAYRFLESVALFPSSLIQVLFPVAAKKTGISAGQLIKITLAMVLIGILFGLGIYLIGPFFILTFFRPEYFQAVPILKIFSLVLFLFFLNSPLATVVQSSRLVGKFLPYGIANTAVNLVLNIVFIPNYGIIAAAWIMAITEVTGFIINLIFVKKLYQARRYNAT